MTRLNLEERPIWAWLIGRDKGKQPRDTVPPVCPEACLQTLTPLDATSIVQLRGSGQVG